MENQYLASDGRPFYRRLPQETPEIYQENPAVDYLTKYWDILFKDCVNKLDDLPRQFNPEFCDPEWLDFIALMCGFTSPFWDKNYPLAGKRLILKNSFSRIWNNKGSLDCVSFILTSLDIDHKIIQPGSFIVGQSQLNITPLGQNGWQFAVILPIKYQPNGYEVRLAQKIVELFAPCWCRSSVGIDDTTILGEIILSTESNTILNLTNSIGVIFINAPGNFRDTGGTFRNPIVAAEEVYLRLN